MRERHCSVLSGYSEHRKREPRFRQAPERTLASTALAHQCRMSVLPAPGLPHTQHGAVTSPSVPRQHCWPGISALKVVARALPVLASRGCEDF